MFLSDGGSGAGGSEYAQYRNIGLMIVLFFAYLWQVLRRQPDAHNGPARMQPLRGRNGPNAPDDEDDAFEREQLRELELQHQLEQAAQRQAAPVIVEGPGGERIEIRPPKQTWTENIGNFIVGFFSSLVPTWRPIPVPMALPDPVTTDQTPQQEQGPVAAEEVNPDAPPVDGGDRNVGNDDEIAAAVEAVEAALAAAE